MISQRVREREREQDGKQRLSSAAKGKVRVAQIIINSATLYQMER